MEEHKRVITSQGDSMTQKGLYLYCITEAFEKLDLSNMGVDDNRVYTIGYKDLVAVVHDCPAAAYDSKDRELVKKWVMAHQGVVEHVWERSGTVVPFSFDTIIRGEESITAEQNLIKWLETDYGRLKEALDKVRGRAEYGVQIFWDPKIMADKIVEDVPEIKKLHDEMKSKPAGAAYLYEEKLKSLVRKEMEKRADNYFKQFYREIRSEVDDMKVDRAKKTDNNLQMIMNLSCLVIKEEAKGLGEVLDGLDSREGVCVRFTGPWPPYSFVGA